MEKEIVTVLKAPELKALDNSKANKIVETFEPMAKMLQSFESKYDEVINESENGVTKELSLKAKRIRLDIGKVRIETGKLKDKQKEYIKLEDRAIMGVHNILVWAVKEKEDKLKSIEDYFEIQEKKRLEALQSERAEKLSQYVEDAHERNLSGMEEDVWEAYFQSKKKEHEDRLEAERKAEEERIAREKAEAEERERIRLENEKLKKEAEERERKAKAEAEKRAKEEKERQAKEEAERKAREEKERKEREKHEAELRAEREAREKVEREAREKREKLEADLKAREEAERKAKEEEEAKRQAELRKTDANKVDDLVSDLKALKTKYSFKSEKGKKVYAEVGGLLDKIIQHIQK